MVTARLLPRDIAHFALIFSIFTDSIRAPLCPAPYAVMSVRGFFTGTTAVSTAFLLKSIFDSKKSTHAFAGSYSMTEMLKVNQNQRSPKKNITKYLRL